MSIRPDAEIDFSWVVISAVCRTQSEHDIWRCLRHIRQRMGLHCVATGCLSITNLSNDNSQGKRMDVSSIETSKRQKLQLP
jgi:hypothetical protein